MRNPATDQIQVIGRHTSYNVQKVLWLAEELGINYSHIQRGGGFGGLDTDEFQKLNPHKKVPVVIDGSSILWESNTILRYLAQMHGGQDWHSDDAFKRSTYERWMDWSIDKFEPAFVGVFWGYFRTPEDERDIKAIRTSVSQVEDCFNILDREIERSHSNYILDNGISLADIATGIFLYRLDTIDLPVMFPANVKSWYDRLKLRKGYQRWVMSDYTELYARSNY